MTKYLKLLRVKHYIKNVLIYIPLFFAREIFNLEKLKLAFVGMIAFSFISSAIYIINDINDIEKDRLHPKKKNRPLASGAISKNNALIVMFLCFAASVTICLCIKNYKALFSIMLYFAVNIAYSKGLKDIPILDVTGKKYCALIVQKN